jgi:hypothetical protein
MRLDKDLWLTSCQEYGAHLVTDAQLFYWTPAARAFVSIWLELLQDDRAPGSRLLRTVSLPDLLSELNRTMGLFRGDQGPVYRLRSVLQSLTRRYEAIHCDYPGKTELGRLDQFSREYVRLCDAPKSERKKADHELRLVLGLEENAEVNSYRFDRIRSLGRAIGCMLNDRDEYRNCLLAGVWACFDDPNFSFQRIISAGTPLFEELLAFSLERGFSRESLAELPIKYLRADRQGLEDPSLTSRLRLVFGAFRAQTQNYSVFLPLEGPTLEISGDIFPQGVTLLSGPAVAQVINEFAQDQEFLPPAGQALKVDVTRYVHSEEGASESLPRDIFAARDVAIRAARQCLDAVYLYRSRTGRPNNRCGVQVLDEGAPYRKALDIDRDHHIQTTISMDFIRPVPPDWSDALHWFRIGTSTPKHEAGIVNLWTAAEILAGRGEFGAETNLGKILGTVGVMASIALFYEDALYLAQAARAYTNRYGPGQMPPLYDLDERHLLEWWVNLGNHYSLTDLTDMHFQRFPHLGHETDEVKRWVATGRVEYERRKGEIIDAIAWIYGCRNDVVHQGRQHIPGAAIARRLLAEYLSLTLQWGLSFHARGMANAPMDSFVIAQEIETTILSMLGAGRYLDALLRLA